MTPSDGHDESNACDRRAALKLFASGLALGLASCGRPEEQLLPYVEQPESIVPGVTEHYATALPFAGYGRGVIGLCREGRPVKLEGNPAHPASLGATDVFIESALASLYDPNRSRAVLEKGEPSSMAAFRTMLAERLPGLRERQGAGLALLSNRITSPTELRLIDELRKALPQMRWHRWEAVDDDNARQGARLAFGRRLDALPKLDAARVVLCLDADPLGHGPAQLALARAFADAKRARHGQLPRLRLYAAEPVVSLTGAMADHRMAVRSEYVAAIATLVANTLGGGYPEPTLPDDARRFAEAVARDLAAYRGEALVLAGPAQPPAVHALVHWINAALGAPGKTMAFIEPVDPVEEDHAASLAALADGLRKSEIEALVILGAHPVYSALPSLDFAEALTHVAVSVHVGQYEDETAKACNWHLPASDPLEAWTDIAAFDGTEAIAQPLMRPLFDTRSAAELLAILLDPVSEPKSYDIVRATWQARHTSADFEAWWRQAVQNGVVPDTAAKAVPAPAPNKPDLPTVVAAEAFTAEIRPDPALWDGRFAPNPWLHECPKPLTKEVWGNAAGLAPADATRLGIADGTTIRLTRGQHTIDIKAVLIPGQAPGTIALTLGYGRRQAGPIGTGVGVDVKPLQTRDSLWSISGIQLEVGAPGTLTRTSEHTRIAGDNIFRWAAPDQLQAAPASTPVPPSFFPVERHGRHAWAMVIDTSVCIGCNACVIACQAENNVPVVGPEEIARGRDMHWLRVDVHGGPQHRIGFQPVPCMHCETAPCEPVCPVEASVHDSEGLNLQVYNRCIGTRFCQANCPYKVRRFNFFGYADGQEYANLGDPLLAALKNPEVTVRARGVMEKCTYCVQRISAARREAERSGSEIGADAVVTACQAACPTRAITFGDLNQTHAPVSALKHEPHHYAMLAELGTRPRTTYLARVVDANPALAEDAT